MNPTIPEGTVIQRSLAGAKLSIPEYNTSYYLGGQLSSTTAGSDTFSPGWNLTQDSMIIYDHTTDTLRNVSMTPPGTPANGYFHGQAQHLKTGMGKGLIISVFGESYPVGEFFDNKLTGNPVNLPPRVLSRYSDSG